MATLSFNPQPIFRGAYNTTGALIKEHRSLFNPAYEYFVDYGGRGSGKSFDKATAVILEATIRRVRVLVTREFLGSIAESTKAEIETRIDELGLSHFFTITKDQIVGNNGSKFMFKGLKNNINNIKSIAAVDIVVVEEAEGVSEVCWDRLLPSIRPRSGRMIVIVIFNPDSKLDATWNQWIVNTPEKTLLTSCNYPDSIHFPDNLERQRAHDEKVLPPRRYEKKWLGIPSGAEGDIIIDEIWIEAARFASRDPDWVKVGEKRVCYDPAGQGRDNNAVIYADGNCIEDADEWAKSDDLREATRRALTMVSRNEADSFVFDECGGFGDGVSVFIDDNMFEDHDGTIRYVGDEAMQERGFNNQFPLEVIPFNSGKPINTADDDTINDTEKSPNDIYCNQKALVHGITAQKLYNTFRFVKLGERDIDPNDMLSIDIEDDALFNKIQRELSTALWIKAENTGKKRVEPKEAMKKRTGQESPNLNDVIMMLAVEPDTGVIADAY